MKFTNISKKTLLLIIFLGYGVSLFSNNKPFLAQANEGFGIIKGATSYPSDFIPAQKLCATNIETRQQHCTETEEEQGSYEIKVPPGNYIVSATLCSSYSSTFDCLSFEPVDEYSEGNFFTQASECQFEVDCFDRNNITPLILSIQRGEIVSDVKIDWYQKIPFSTTPSPAIQSNSARNLNKEAEQLVKKTELPLYYGSLEEKKAAIANLKKSLSILQQNIDNPNSLFFAQNIASQLCAAAFEIEDWSSAEKYCQLSLEIQQELQKSNPEITTHVAYSSLASIYEQLGNYKKAISTTKKAEQRHRIEETSREIMRVGGEVDSALGQKMIEIERAKFSTRIAQLAFLDQDYDLAVKYYTKAKNTRIELEQKYPSTNEDSSDLVNYPIMDSTGLGYSLLRQNKIKKAKLHFDKTYQMFKEREDFLVQKYTSNRGTNPFLGVTNQVTSVYHTYEFLYDGLQELNIEQGNYEKALEFAEERRTGAMAILLSEQLNTNYKRFDTLTIDKIKQIAKENSSTIVYYSMLTEEKLAIWVINSEGVINLRQIHLNLGNNLSISKSTQKTSLATFFTILIIFYLFICYKFKGHKLSKGALILCIPLLTLSSCQNSSTNLSFSNTKEFSNVHFSSLIQSAVTETRGINKQKRSISEQQLNCHEQNNCLRSLSEIIIEPIEDLLPDNTEEQNHLRSR